MPRKNFLKLPTNIPKDEEAPELEIEIAPRATTDHKEVFEKNNSPIPSPRDSPSPSPSPSSSPRPTPSLTIEPIKPKATKKNGKIDLKSLSSEELLHLTDSELVYGKSIENLTNGQKRMLLPKAVRKRKAIQKKIDTVINKAKKNTDRELARQKKKEDDKERYKKRKEIERENKRIERENKENDRVLKRVEEELTKRERIFKEKAPEPPPQPKQDKYQNFASMMDRYNRETGRSQPVYRQPPPEPEQPKPKPVYRYDPWGAQAKYDRLNRNL